MYEIIIMINVTMGAIICLKKSVTFYIQYGCKHANSITLSHQVLMYDILRSICSLLMLPGNHFTPHWSEAHAQHRHLYGHSPCCIMQSFSPLMLLQADTVQPYAS